MQSSLETPRVCIVTQQLGTVRTGVGTYGNLLVTGLRDRGWAVTVATFEESCGAIDGVDYMPIRRRRPDPTPGDWWSLATGFGALVDSVDADLIHYVDAREALRHRGPVPAVGTVHDAYALDAPRAPWAMRERHPDWLRRGAYYAALRRAEPIAYRKLRALFANADDTRAKVVEGYGLDSRTVETIRLGVDLPATVEAEPLAGAPSILFVGSNYYRKGLDRVVRAVRRSIGGLPGVRLHIVGRDPNRTRIERLAEDVGIADRLVFHDRVEQQRLYRMMAGATMFCMPSTTEGYGLVFLESMNVGTPVIGGDVGGTRELIRCGVNGLTVPPDDTAKLARAIQRLALDARLRDYVVRNGHETVAAHAGDAMVDAVIDGYARHGLVAARTEARVAERLLGLSAVGG